MGVKAPFMRVQAYGLYEGEWSVSSPSRFIPREMVPDTYRIGCFVILEGQFRRRGKESLLLLTGIGLGRPPLSLVTTATEPF